MLTLVLSLLFNIIIWSAVFFFLRKVQAPTTNGTRHLRSAKSYQGIRTASANILVPMLCFFIVLVFVVFFSYPHVLTAEARLSGAGFVLISFLAYLYLLRSIMEGKKP